MSQTHAPESAPESISTRRINFSDGNHALHVQALFAWLPEDLHDAPGIDWTQLPSEVICYLVNTVGESLWVSALASAAGIGSGAMKPGNLLTAVRHLNLLLRSISTICGCEHVSELTKSVWKAYMSQKEQKPGDFHNFMAYSAFTELHFPYHLEQLTSQERARLEPFLPPRLPRGFLKQHFPYPAKLEGEKQRRKEKSDVLAPIHSLLVALVRFRKQSSDRLLSAYHEALSQARKGDIKLPLPFSYEEEMVTINRDARTVAEVQLEKRPVTLRFLLWDRKTWVLKHPNDYKTAIKRNAKLGIEEFAEPQFFVECLNPPEDLLWFGGLIKYRLLQKEIPARMSPEYAQQRQQHDTLLQDYVQKDVKIAELEAEVARHRQYLEGLRLTIQRQEHQGP